MEALITTVNQWGSRFIEYAGLMLVQAGILIVVLLVLDRILKKHIRASVRYCIWMLMLIKLVLSPHLSFPISVGNWIHLLPDSQVMTSLNAKPDTLSTTQEQTHLGPAATQGQTVGKLPGTIQMTWQGMVLLAWFAGIVILGLSLVYRARYIYRIIKSAERPDDRLFQILSDAKRESNIRLHIGLRLTRCVSSPSVCGIWRPVILLPRVLADGFPEDDIRTVIVHELCHIKRADPWINWVQTLIQAFYFYNPLVWLANNCIRRVREQAVDEGVLVCLKGRLKCYSHTLIDIAEVVTLRPGPSLGLIGVAESKTRLKERIHLMQNRPMPKHTRLGVFWLVTIVFLGILILPMATTRTQSNEIELFEPATDQVHDDLIAESEAMKAYDLSAWQAGDVSGIVSNYAPDAISLPLDSETVIDMDATKENIVKGLQQGIMLVDVKSQSHQHWVCGDLFYLFGSCSNAITAPEFTGEMTLFFNGLSIFQKQDDGSFKTKLSTIVRIQAPHQPMSFGSQSPYDAAVWKWKAGDFNRGSEEVLYNEIRYMGKKDIIQIEGDGNLIYRANLYAWDINDSSSGDETTLPGKGVHVWQHQPDGSWQLFIDADNTYVSIG